MSGEVTWCYNQEYRWRLDDCGSYGCSLTKETWNEWDHEDFCIDCYFAQYNEGIDCYFAQCDEEDFENG